MKHIIATVLLLGSVAAMAQEPTDTIKTKELQEIVRKSLGAKI